jgi:predicted house-cleaning noncanonical NTP pyrophosphatase (MazG superfamily)
MIKIYNKLVRDKIPEIIEADGEEPKVRILSESDYRKALLEKLVEESREALETGGDPEKLAMEIGDVLEVVDATVKAHHLNWGQIEEARRKRREGRGGFEKRLFLESTEPKSE